MKTFENISGKGENAGNQHIVLDPTKNNLESILEEEKMLVTIIFSYSRFV